MQSRNVRIVGGPRKGQTAVVLRDRGATFEVAFADGTRGFIGKFYCKEMKR